MGYAEEREEGPGKISLDTTSALEISLFQTPSFNLYTFSGFGQPRLQAE